MSPQEYIQLKAFARQDGALLSLLWIGGFACYILGLANPTMGMLALLLIVASPFFAASRLRHFRDYAREGIITFRRGYAYTVLTFFYGGLLLGMSLLIGLVRNVLEPRLMAGQLALPPFFALAGVYIGGRLFGASGVIVLPLAMVILRSRRDERKT